MEQRRLYVVRGVAKSGTVTYNCPTAGWALRKLRDFKTAGHQDITVTDPDGAPLTENELTNVVERSGAEPPDEVIPAATQITRQPAQA